MTVNTTQYSYAELVQQLKDACKVIVDLQENLVEYLNPSASRDFERLADELWVLKEAVAKG